MLLNAVRAVIFDVGNTLAMPDWQRISAIVTQHCDLKLDEQDLHARFCSVLREADGDRDFLSALAGKTIQTGWHFRRVYEELGLDKSQLDCLARELDHAHLARHLWSKLNGDAVPVLKKLRRQGMRLAAISNSEDGRVEELLILIGLTQYLDLYVDSYLIGFTKPDPRIFLRTVEKLGVEPREAVYVGDSFTQDVIGAREAGLLPILFDPHDLHTKVNAIRIHSLQELI